MKKLKTFRDRESNITSDDIEKCATEEELQKLKTTIEANLVNVKQQIDKASGEAIADGNYADPDWWARVNACKRVLGYLHQRILVKQREFKFNKKDARENDIDRLFKEAAKEILPPDMFYKILSAAHEMKPKS